MQMEIWLKLLIEEACEVIKWEEVKSSTIDIKSKFDITTLINKYPTKLYKSENWTKAIIDLRQIFASVHATPKLFIFKDMCRDGFKLSYTNDKVAKTKLKEISIGVHDGKKITAWDVYQKYPELFTYNYLSFYNKDSKAFSFFRGYDFEEVDKIDFDKINPFLKHIKEIICKNDPKLDEYIQKWFASILQGPDCKLHTALVLIGCQGCGKNVFTNVLCKLMKRYSIDNINDIDHIAGKFNASIENRKLIVCNELQSVEANKYLNSDKLKSVLTDSTISINQKCEPLRQTDNVANFIFVSNNMNPLKIESRDRRYCVLEVSDEVACKSEYFNTLCEGFTEEFYSHLFTYFMRLDLKGFNHRDIPVTEMKKDIIEANKNSVELFFQNYYEEIEERNIKGPELWDMYLEFCGAANKVPDYFHVSKKNFCLSRKEYVVEKVVKDSDRKSIKVFKMVPQILVKLRDEFPIDNTVAEEREQKQKESEKDAKIAVGIVDEKMDAVFDNE